MACNIENIDKRLADDIFNRSLRRRSAIIILKHHIRYSEQ